MCSANHACICSRKTSESSKRQSTRETVFPSSVSRRGASSLRVTVGAKPIGFRTVSLSFIPMGPSLQGEVTPSPGPLPQLVQVSRRDDRLPDYDRGVGERPHASRQVTQRRPQL